MSSPLLFAAGGHSRPSPVRQAPLPSWDSSDPGGDVHTTPPPEWQPPRAYDRLWWRGDFGGVMLDPAPPFVPGANTTPPEMTMSFLLPLYRQFGMKLIDRFLTAHAVRNYSHFHLDRGAWDRAGFGIQDVVDLAQYLVSWGFFVSYWATGSGDDRSQGWASCQPLVEPVLRALIAAPGMADKLIVLPGEELDNGMSPEGIDDLLDRVAAICNPVGVPVFTHYTSNKPCWQPNGMTPTQWWASKVGKLAGTCWQANDSDPTGTMGAHAWDTRKYLAAADPSLRWVAFELRANSQLFGRYTEEQGCLTSIEINYCPIAPGSNAPGVSGGGNGLGRYRDGSPI